jgi:hypothetical protein
MNAQAMLIKLLYNHYMIITVLIQSLYAPKEPIAMSHTVHANTVASSEGWARGNRGHSYRQ